MTSPVASRFGQVEAQQTYVTAALVAAHAMSEADGFRPTDVRFFFLLFTNWVEHDVLHPTQDLALTQVRRVMQRLVADGRAEADAKGRHPRYSLTEEGLTALVHALVEPEASSRRPLDESLFVLSFATLYRSALARRLRLDTTAKLRRRLARELEPARILAAAQRRTRDLLADLEERCRTGAAMQNALDRAPSDDASRVAALQSLGSYQLERVRPVAEVLAALPADVRQRELSVGPGTRVRLLFEPLAAVLRQELKVLECMVL